MGVDIFFVGGVASGLSGTVVLRNNGVDDLTLSADGAFAFATRLPTGSAYSVIVKTQPVGQTCIVSNGSGTVGSANVTTVRVTCGMGYPIGGTVSGLVGVGCVFQNNGSDALGISANGAFTFPTWLPAGQSYSATVRTQPTGPTQACAVSNGSGIASGPVTDILVTCSVSQPPCGGAAFLGSVRGDEWSDVLTASGAGEAWFRVRITEASAEVENLSATVTLSAPSGIQYLLEVYCLACGGEVGGGGLDVAVGWKDRWPFVNDDGDILVRVRYIAGSSGSNWTLQVRGHTPPPWSPCTL